VLRVSARNDASWAILTLHFFLKSLFLTSEIRHFKTRTARGLKIAPVAGHFQTALECGATDNKILILPGVVELTVKDLGAI
jgi:hypothetical protein